MDEKTIEKIIERQGEIKREIEGLHLAFVDYTAALKAEFRENMIQSKTDVRNGLLEFQRAFLDDAKARFGAEAQPQVQFDVKMTSAQREAIDYHFQKALEFDQNRHLTPEGIADKRDFFAAHAMRALLTGYVESDYIHFPEVASDAYHIADAMLKARKEKA